MRPKVSFVILKGARRNIPHDEPLGQSETKTITLRIHSIQVIPSGLLMSYRISLSEGVASVVSSRQRSGYYSFYHGLDGFMSYGDKTDQKVCCFPLGLRPCSLMRMLSHVSELPCLTIHICLVCLAGRQEKPQSKIAALGSTK